MTHEALHTVETLAVKKLWQIWQITAIRQIFCHFHYFHNIPYTNGHQFTKVSLPNFLQSLFAKLFHGQSFLLYGILTLLYTTILYIAYCSW